MSRALAYAATFDFPVWLHPQDPYLSAAGYAHDGDVASRLGLPAIPATAETIAIATYILLVRETGARVHLCRLSTRAGVEMVMAAKKEGLPITADVSAHHLHLSDRDIGWFDPMYHLSPPLRNPRDRDALQEALANGTIDAVCSDHSPVDDDTKQVPFGESSVGATGLELLLPLTLKWAKQQGVSLSLALQRITLDPARLLGLSAGTLQEGRSADVCIFNPTSPWTISRDTLVSQGKNTPYLGYELEGRVQQTLVAGNIVFDRTVKGGRSQHLS
jgi:dihydroorotase